MKNIFVTPKDDISKIVKGVQEPVCVHLAEGIYNQKVEINHNDVTLIGANRETTIIAFSDYARKIHADGKEYNTFRTHTVRLSGERAVMKNLTVVNSNTNPAEIGQCVALYVHSKSFTGENLKLVSTQDTLFLSPFPDDLVTRYRNFLPPYALYTEGGSRHLFKNCEICGTVDFIFGGAEAYFYNCDIISLHDSRGHGYIAAPSHCLAEKHGFTFYKCRLKSQGAEDGSVYLARPWRDYGKCAFVDCTAERHISPLLFDKWNDTDRDKTARFLYAGLDCDFTPSPVPWAHELTRCQKNALENDVKAVLSEIL